MILFVLIRPYHTVIPFVICIITNLRLFSGSGKSSRQKMSSTAWKTALAELLTFTHETLHLVNDISCQQYFVEGLLCSGDLATVQFASEYIQPTVIMSGKEPYVKMVICTVE